MPGARSVFKGGIIPRALILVTDNGTKRKSAGFSVCDAGQKFRFVGFRTGGGMFALAAAASFHKSGKAFKVDRFACGKAVYHAADGLAVGLAENTDKELVSEFR